MRVTKNNKGQALVEFAVVLPILLLLVMGIVQFGMMINAYLSIQYVSREGARAGIVGSTDDEIKNLIAQDTPTLDASNLVIAVTPDASNRNSGDTLTVTVTYNYIFTVPVISNMYDKPIALEAQTSMRIE